MLSNKDSRYPMSVPLFGLKYLPLYLMLPVVVFFWPMYLIQVVAWFRLSEDSKKELEYEIGNPLNAPVEHMQVLLHLVGKSFVNAMWILSFLVNAVTAFLTLSVFQ